MLALVRYEICGEELPIGFAEALTPERLSSLYKLSARHDIGHLVGDALQRLSLLSGDIGARFIKARELAIYRYTQMQYEYNRITEALENAKIAHMPLKGAIIREYYPKGWMRTSCDIDILIRAEELSTARELLVDGLGYKMDGEHTEHDITLVSPAGVRLELHHTLCDAGDEWGRDILSDIWSYAVLKDGCQTHYILPDDIFYFYHIEHMARHFTLGGCGVRPLIDLWLLNRADNIDREKRTERLKSASLYDFALVMERLSDVWLSGGESDETLKEIEEYIILGGVYGNAENRVAVQQSRSGGRLKYLMSRVFISNEALKRKYPILEKRPYLLPIYHIARWFKPLFNRKSKENSLRDVKITKKATKSEEKTRRLFERLGL